MPIKYFRILFILISLMGISREALSQKYTFKQAVSERKITFKMPRGFSDLASNYTSYYAIKDSTTGVEALYSYNLLNAAKALADDSSSYKAFVARVSTIAAESAIASLNIGNVDPGHAKTDFNADFGLTAFFKPSPEFVPSFSNCIAVLIKKNNVGEVYIFILFNVLNRETEVVIGDILGSVDWK